MTKESTAIVTLTRRGQQLAIYLKKCLEKVDIYSPLKLKTQGVDINYFQSSLKDLTDRLFKEYNNIIYIMALGIVIRVIAPHLRDKRVDPAVITIDDTGRNVISTLSGHLGGANKLTEEVAGVLKANPVITTATDCQGKPAIDLLAKKMNCIIEPFENLKMANAAIVNDQPLSIFTDYNIDLSPSDNITIYSLRGLEDWSKTGFSESGFPVIISNKSIGLDCDYLQLIPRNIIVGIGCRRGVLASEINKAVDDALNILELHQKSIKNIATIDLKEDETGLLEYAAGQGLEIDIIQREDIINAQLNISSSDFVQEKIGVPGVCEPAALLSSCQGKLIMAKTKFNKVTVAVVEEEIINGG